MRAEWSRGVGREVEERKVDADEWGRSVSDGAGKRGAGGQRRQMGPGAQGEREGRRALRSGACETGLRRVLLWAAGEGTGPCWAGVGRAG